MKRTLFAFTTLAAAVVSTTAWAGAPDVLPQVRERFASADATEVPDFQRHLVPLLGKLGCNGRACHGSFQGRGGFRLSLFGYDFKMDHEGLTERIDRDSPADSYVLQKPLLKEDHEGGKRFEEGSWEHHLFLKWIEAGATPRPDDAASLVTLEVTPSELICSAADQKTRLKAVAVWSDGSREDVTCLCRFQTNDDAIAKVTPSGEVTSGDTGDTHVVVFYDNAVIPIPVIRPVSDKFGDKYPQIAAPTPIDSAILEKLSKLGVLPSDKCDDAEFLRRVSLDIAGTLPSAGEVRAFLSDSSPDKRSQKINELLETPAYAAWWTTRLCDWTGANDNALNNVNPVDRQSGSKDWYEWLYKRVVENMPYDKLVEGIVVAQCRNPGETYEQYCERQSSYYHGDNKSFADSPGLFYFWGRNNFRTEEDRAIGFAYTFMGTRIQCAQCHKHPFDVWTQEDFKQFEQFFTRVNFARTGDDKKTYDKLLTDLGIKGKKNGNEQRRAMSEAVKGGKTIPFPEVVIRTGRKPEFDEKKAEMARKKGEEYHPPEQNARLLGGETVNLAEVADPREALMKWLRHDEKQLFAKALVNRVWSNYFHRGIVEPTDDLSLANPPANQALLDYLARGFVDHGYDMKWLHREICNSDAYQRTWKPNDTNAGDERNFSHAIPRRMPAEASYDALLMATANTGRANAFLTDLGGRTLKVPGTGRNNNVNGVNYALTVFGRSTRESNCDCDRSSEASLLQVIFTRNDTEIYEMIDRKDGWVAEVSKGAAREAKPDAQASNRSRRNEIVSRIETIEQGIQEHKAAAKDNPKLKDKIQRAQKELTALRKELRAMDGESAPQKEAEKPAVARIDVPLAIEEGYLRTLSRFPTDDERKIAATFLQQEDPAKGLRDLVWTLVNTKEFIVNH